MASSNIIPAICTLPQELHDDICSYLRLHDIYALRLTNRHLHAILPPLPDIRKVRFDNCYYDGDIPISDDYWMNYPIEETYLARSNNLLVCEHCLGLFPQSKLKFMMKWVGCTNDYKRLCAKCGLIQNLNPEVPDANMPYPDTDDEAL